MLVFDIGSLSYPEQIIKVIQESIEILIDEFVIKFTGFMIVYCKLLAIFLAQYRISGCQRPYNNITIIRSVIITGIYQRLMGDSIQLNACRQKEFTAIAEAQPFSVFFRQFDIIFFFKLSNLIFRSTFKEIHFSLRLNLINNFL